MLKEKIHLQQGDVTDNELLSAKNTVNSFNTAFKYYLLYPKDHAYLRNHLAKLETDLDKFFTTYDTLRLDVNKNGFFYKDHPVFIGSPVENNPAFLLTRDTILSIELSSGINLKEITLFFDILNAHKNLTGDVDGDIASALWHYSFDHIEYEAADIFALDAIDFNLSMYKAAPERKKSDASPEKDPHEQAKSTEDISPSLLTIAKESDFSELSIEENQEVQALIDQEETKQHNDDVADLLLIVLTLEDNQIDFATILEFLEFEFFDAMQMENFSVALKICKNIHKISEAIQPKKPWAVPLINLFLTALVKKERLSKIPWIKKYNGISDPEKTSYICAIFDLLPADIIFTLAPFAGQIPIQDLNFRNKIIEIISNNTKSDPTRLIQLLEKSDEQTSLLLFPILENMDTKNAAPVYLKMTRHNSPTIRRIGMDGYFTSAGPADPEKVIHLLQDDDEQVRHRLVAYLEQNCDSSTEKMLIAFLADKEISLDDERYILQCYKLLGQCISSRSLPFLREILLESKMTGMFNNIKNINKSGASYALLMLGTEEAIDILKTGAKSVRSDVRQVCQKALQHMDNLNT